MPIVTFVLEAPGTGARRALLAVADAVEKAHPGLEVRRIDGVDLPLSLPWTRPPDGDVLVSARPLERRGEATTVALIPSWHVARRWRGAACDAAVVAHADLVDAAAERTGLGSDAVFPFGLPVDGAAGTNRRTARRRLGLADDADVLLVQAGGLDEDLLGRSLFQWTLLESPPTLLLSAGGDERTAKVLRRDAPSYGLPPPATPPGLPTLLAAADLVVVPPDGVAVAEAHAAGTPVVVLGARAAAPGNRFLSTRRAAVAVESVLTLAAEVDRLRADSAGLEAMAAGGTRLVRRDAATRFSDLVAQAAVDPEALRGTRVGAPEAAEAGPILEDLGAPEASTRADVDASAGLAAVRSRLEEVRQRLRLWRDRVELARSAGDRELEQAACNKVHKLEELAERLTAQAERLSKAKPAADAPRQRPARNRMEERFRELEVEAALRELKRRVADEDD